MPTIDLPLFPLGQVVLAPMMSLPLHVFEPRYREMVAECLEADRRFGVVLIREGAEVGETAIPHAIGTVAEITVATRLDDGRYGIWTEGRRRFRTVERYYDRAYLHAAVELLEEPLGVVENTLSLAQEVRTLALSYREVVTQLAGDVPAQVTFPEEPIELSYRILGTLQVQDREKQQLLEAETAEDRLRHEHLLLRRELLILSKMLELPKETSSPFNPN